MATTMGRTRCFPWSGTPTGRPASSRSAASTSTTRSSRTSVQNREINDFKAELVTNATGLDLMRLSIEVRRGAERGAVAEAVAAATKATFEVTPDIVVLDTGTLAKEFESSVKAPRFSDKRD